MTYRLYVDGMLLGTGTLREVVTWADNIRAEKRVEIRIERVEEE